LFQIIFQSGYFVAIYVVHANPLVAIRTDS
jgi:hypothetical protein